MKLSLLQTVSCWFLLVLVSVAAAADVESITERMRERLPAIDELKEAGTIGENNRALLEARSELEREQRELIQEENADRQTLYELVAERTDQSLDEVARQRAARIAQLATRGVWLQNMRGKWYRKGEE